MRIFVTQLAAGEHAVVGDDHHYISRVRRARTGDVVELVDGKGQRARGEIVRMTASETFVRVDAIESVVEMPPRLRVLVPLIKGDRMDACIEKLVEVGADELLVWPAARSVVKLEPARRQARIEHYGATILAAARQCGRASTPTVAYADSLTAAIATLPAPSSSVARLLLDPTADRTPAPTIAVDVTIASGPEGGLALAELERLLAADFEPFGLGPRVLRAETAPVIAVALVRAATAS